MARVGIRLRAAEMQDGLEDLLAEGGLTFNGHSYVLTEAGFRLLD